MATIQRIHHYAMRNVSRHHNHGIESTRVFFFCRAPHISPSTTPRTFSTLSTSPTTPSHSKQGPGKKEKIEVVSSTRKETTSRVQQMRGKFNDFVASFDLDYLIALGGPETSTVPDLGRPQTPWERFKNFPKGVKALLKDCIRYKNIHDASKTPLNAWTINSPLKRPGDRGRGFFLYENEIRPGRIPRRQFEQQRQLQHDFRIMIPLILVWIPPIIGFVPPILAMMAPRQVMSRQFNNEYEALYFNEIEYNQRKLAFMDLGKMFWSNFPAIDLRKGYFQECPEDLAGPILDGMFLYSAFCLKNPDPGSSFQLTCGEAWTSIRELPRDYLVKLCLSIGVCQQWPEWMSRRIVSFAPTLFLWRQVERISAIVCHDDALLLEEGHDLNMCESLTDQEVADACLMRALPVSLQHTSQQRREMLTNHLQMIANVKRHMHGPFDETDGFRLLTLHLSPLRYYLKEQTKR
ncbi:LETM1-like protein [Nitzschia inconspicua]|uniref:LETM1-like protein n=1 Tax=Nitzschia inconspicua TaxID=303405 RepID=A0A9K3PI95_9STRA|nr:LETM1-like protein [Nitzschia inconspicua]